MTDSGTKLVPTIDLNVAAAARAKIANVGTLIDQKALGQPLLSPTPVAGQEVVVTATDASGDILLASVNASPDGNTFLGVDSTALALSRLMIGSVTDVSGAETNSAIQAAASFATLQLAIKGALDSGKVPTTEITVLQVLGNVIGEAQFILRSRKGLSKQAPLGKEQVITPLPYSVLGATGPLPSVYVKGSDGAGVQVSNATPLYWSATTVGPVVLLEPSSILTVALGSLTPWLGPQTYDLADKGGPSFELIVQQNVASQRASLSNILRSLYSLALDNFPAGAAAQVICKNSIADALISSDTLDLLASDPSVNGFKNYLTGTAFEFRALATTATKCLSNTPEDFAKAAGAFVKSIAKLAVGLSQVQSGLTSLGLGFQLGELTKFWNRSFPVQVCQSKGFFSLNVRNCTAKFELQGKPLVAVPRAQFTSPLQAYDKDGAITGFPAASRYRSYNEAVAKIDPQVGTVSALIAGDAEIEIYDESVPVAYKFPVRVVNPTISPLAEVANIEDTRLFTLVDSQGAPVIADGSGTVWNSSDPTVGQIVIFGGVGAVNVVARKPGNTVITATNPATGIVASAVLAVKPATQIPVSATLTVPDQVPGWTGFPAAIVLSSLSSIAPSDFRNFGSNCPERGVPLYSSSVSNLARFFRATSSANMPSRIGGPFVNRLNCSSFVALQEVQEPGGGASRQRVIINATGRGQQFGGATLDWEYQIRYDSGDPYTGVGKRCDVGIVANSGNYGIEFSSAACSHALAF